MAVIIYTDIVSVTALSGINWEATLALVPAGSLPQAALPPLRILNA